MHGAPAARDIAEPGAVAVIVLLEREGIGAQEFSVEVMQPCQRARLFYERHAVLGFERDGLCGDLECLGHV